VQRRCICKYKHFALACAARRAGTDEAQHDAKRAEVQAFLGDLEARFATVRGLARAGGPYFLGQLPSIADVSVITLLARFDVLLKVSWSLCEGGSWWGGGCLVFTQ
jgi:glutathione S-transferase